MSKSRAVVAHPTCPTSTLSAPARQEQAAYAAPHLTELGAWQAVTLIVSLPIQLGAPGTQGQPPRF